MSRCQREDLLVPMAKFALQIRPKFFEDVTRHIDSDPQAELIGGIARSAVVNIVSIGNGDRGGVPDDLRVIELGTAGIGVGPEDLAGGVSEPGPSAPLALTEVARVLMKKDRENALGHVVADDEVTIGKTEIFAETGGALAERAIRIRHLAFRSEDARENDRPAVEGIFGSDFKFLPGRERLIVLETRRASVIGDNAQKTLAFRRGRGVRCGTFRR